ncbi:hypothetical protein Vi05172_g4702 [Venturia inaequalis]|nr:hypothetical protein Vi05172_g4702 [Venturia inaequalis]
MVGSWITIPLRLLSLSDTRPTNKSVIDLPLHQKIPFLGRTLFGHRHSNNNVLVVLTLILILTQAFTPLDQQTTRTAAS